MSYTLISIYLYAFVLGSSALDRKEKNDKTNKFELDDADGEDTNDQEDRRSDEKVLSPTSRRNKFKGHGSSVNNQLGRLRWPTSNDGLSDINAWSRSNGFGLK